MQSSSAKDFMKHLFYLFIFSTLAATGQNQESQPVLKTRWADQINIDSPLPEYPRPQMVRENWMSLNGQWDLAVTNYPGTAPQTFDDQITVPFAIESTLSGVKKRISSNQRIWYKRSFQVPTTWKNQRLLLHFEAVDWEAVVYVNHQKVGVHQGGYDPFVIDITDALIGSGPQELMVAVWDPTSEGTQPRGKQATNPQAIWYTPVSGIWQSVWLEPVKEQHISGLKTTPDLDNGRFLFKVTANKWQNDDLNVAVDVKEGTRTVASGSGKVDTEIAISLNNPKLWSPNSPFLYDIEVRLMKGKRTLDKVNSYAGMRKIGQTKDAKGHMRFTLNNEIIFMYGTLDQGWWPDGLYTAPTDEALQYDIKMTKDMGFNTIRKHVKVESARWYYHCDKIGILVWQDMPSGDKSARWDPPSGYAGIEMQRTAQSKQQFFKEWKAIMTSFHNHPSIVMWVPFNEGWGQFETQKTIEWTMNEDLSRLVNGPSGGNFFPAGHTVDHHQYPGPGVPDKALYPPVIFKDRVLLLGEFGGLGLPLKGHLWQQDKNWGYRNLEKRDELFRSYSEMLDKLPALIEEGLGAAIYTQTTDIEGEVNGLITYDREVIKMDPDKMKEATKQLYRKH